MSFLQKYLFIACLFVSFSALGQSTEVYQVKGVITDSLSKETLPFANVFFSGTTFGTVSNKEGEFVLSATGPGTYDLVISFTGYDTFYQQVDLNQPGQIRLNVALVTDAKLIGGVTVTAKKDQKWRENLYTFKQTFLGKSENAAEVRILNEEALDFDYDPKTRVFTAWANEPLIIENKALGYRLKYVLEDFVIYYQYNFSSFYGFPSFEDMNKRGKVPKRWVRARNKAYYGSVEHFFRELYQGNTLEAGFNVNSARDIEGMGRVFNSQEYDINGSVQLRPDSVRKRLDFDNLLYITYKNESPSPRYRTGFGRGNAPQLNTGGGQMSWIEIPEGVEGIDFEKTGYLINPLAFVLNGYWSFEKIADLMPTDFQPIEQR